jgi:2-polyprenyl-3-methyl-5-hydroxy-6-metoxy-1,4-benzoquinol methylase
MKMKGHWDQVYRTRRPNEVSWYQPHLKVSLQLIEDAAGDRDSAIIDLGGGESTLVDDLSAMGYRNVSVLDMSSIALDVARARLQTRAADVNSLFGDVTTFSFDAHAYDDWHDRAVFHFLTEAEARVAYVRQVARAVKPGGHVIVAAFGPEGPTKCSGLDVSVRAPRAARQVRSALRTRRSLDGFAPDAGRSGPAIHLLLLQSCFPVHRSGSSFEKLVQG